MNLPTENEPPPTVPPAFRVLLAVSCHRIVLGDPDELGHPGGIYVDPRHR